MFEYNVILKRNEEIMSDTSKNSWAVLVNNVHLQKQNTHFD